VKATAALPVDASARLKSFLDDHEVGSGPLDLTRIGDGHSNITCLLRREGARVALRRPPEGPLARSSNDILREARVLAALASTGAPVPRVLAVCEDEQVIGAPFYLIGAARVPADDVEATVAELVETLAAAFHRRHPGHPGSAEVDEERSDPLRRIARRAADHRQ
jgi:aminoglycoside phosphotransferase (APT) family kinase protein